LYAMRDRLKLLGIDLALAIKTIIYSPK